MSRLLMYNTITLHLLRDLRADITPLYAIFSVILPFCLFSSFAGARIVVEIEQRRFARAFWQDGRLRDW
jgi:hypothetical protein